MQGEISHIPCQRNGKGMGKGGKEEEFICKRFQRLVHCRKVRKNGGLRLTVLHGRPNGLEPTWAPAAWLVRRIAIPANLWLVQSLGTDSATCKLMDPIFVRHDRPNFFLIQRDLCLFSGKATRRLPWTRCNMPMKCNPTAWITRRGPGPSPARPPLSLICACR